MEREGGGGWGAAEGEDLPEARRFGVEKEEERSIQALSFMCFESKSQQRRLLLSLLVAFEEKYELGPLGMGKEASPFRRETHLGGNDGAIGKMDAWKKCFFSHRSIFKK